MQCCWSALRKNPMSGTKSAKEIVKDLRKLKRESSRQTASRVLAVRKSQIASGSRIAPQTVEFEAVPGKKPFPLNRWMIIAFTASALLLGSVAWYLFWHRPPELIRLSFESPAGNIFNSTVGGHLEISPDGTMIAFVAVDSSGKDHLWVRPLDSPAPLLLSGTENAYYPFWSHDSKMVVYFADGKLKKIDAKGGPSFTICEASGGRGGTWNKDGVIVFAPGANGPLYQVSSAGGTPKQITTLDSAEFEVNHRWPSFLPDGNHFFYTVQTSKPSLDEDADHIRVASLNDAKTKIVLHASSNIVYNKGWVLDDRQNSLLAQRFDEGSAEVSGEPIPILENLLYARVRSRGTFSLSRNNRLAYLGTSKSDQEMAIYGANGTIQRAFNPRSQRRGRPSRMTANSLQPMRLMNPRKTPTSGSMISSAIPMPG